MIFDFILDLLFPKKCVGCGKEGIWFCSDCITRISCQELPYTRLSSSNLDGLIAVAHFKDPLKEAIHALKYDGVKELAEPLSNLLVQHLKDERLRFVRQMEPLLIPIPLHKSKEIERGFNQSALLSEKLGQKLNLKTEKNFLVKTKKTPAQVKLKGKERRENVKNVFSFVGDKKKIKGKTILLVDDVMTTGSTLNECAKVLKRAGAKKVWGLVLAKD
jgi:ComF family protein